MLSLPTIAFAGSTFFLVTLFVVHFLKRDLQIIQYPLSNYALGKHGWLLSAGLYAIGIAQILLSLSISIVYSFNFGNVFLIGAGLGAIIVALFKMEYPKRTIRADLHNFGAGLQFLLFPLSLVLLSSHFPTNLSMYTLVTGSINFILLIYIAHVFLKDTTHTTPYYGVVQKFNILCMTLWVYTVSGLFVF